MNKIVASLGIFMLFMCILTSIFDKQFNPESYMEWDVIYANYSFWCTYGVLFYSLSIIVILIGLFIFNKRLSKKERD